MKDRKKSSRWTRENVSAVKSIPPGETKYQLSSRMVSTNNSSLRYSLAPTSFL